ncbi:MAG: ThuA domain-containing protein [Mucilaginibacter sp.]|uniref:ThuA domain-containing protein n=1 Tax=Mucilaginibacter sp. TaxID=1882438 RepID=UPI003267A8ED
MKKIGIVLIVICLMAFKPAIKDRVLIFSLTKGYHHASIADGILAIQKLGAENNFDVDTTTNPAKFTDADLKPYKAVIFLSPTGSFFTDEQKSAFQNYIHKGGGFVGIHAATDCLFEWEWYGKLVGAFFIKHPKIQQANLVINDQTNISTKMLPANWPHTDEWYNFKDVNPDIKVLISVDEKSYTGGEMNGNHPIAWYHNFEGGKAFYTALGHTKEDFTTDTLFTQHLLGGIKYALGRKK